ncbi:hypothetical protein K438DRAFT_2018578 [Mycena galopus ATCC 62051]|nr:hypothetical protein K438DRAFT_2018578 [Mycena galopus ATCC 62051]
MSAMTANEKRHNGKRVVSYPQPADKTLLRRPKELHAGTPAPRATQNGVQVLHGCASGAALHPLEHPATNTTTAGDGRLVRDPVCTWREGERWSMDAPEKMTHSVPLPAFLPLIASIPVPVHTLLTLATSFAHTPDLGIGHSTLRSFGLRPFHVSDYLPPSLSAVSHSRRCSESQRYRHRTPPPSLDFLSCPNPPLRSCRSFSIAPAFSSTLLIVSLTPSHTPPPAVFLI